MVDDLRRGAERMGERAEAARERAGAARDAVGERASAARDAAKGAATDAMDAASDAIAAVKPKLRGVSHEWAFFVSLGLGAALIIAAKTPKATARRRHLRGQPLGPARHQRPLPPGRLEAARACAAGCAGSTTR